MWTNWKGNMKKVDQIIDRVNKQKSRSLALIFIISFWKFIQTAEKQKKTPAKKVTLSKLHTTSEYAQSWKPSCNFSTVQTVKDDTTVCGKPQDTNCRHEHYETFPWLVTAA